MAEIIYPKGFLVPQPIVKVDLWANMHWPQMWTAKNSCVGAMALESFLHNKWKYSYFLRSKISDEQLQKEIIPVNNAHRAYEIDELDLDELQYLWELNKINVNKALENTLQSMGLKLKGLGNQRREKAMTNFLDNPQFRPQLQGILRLWQKAATLFTETQIHALSNEYRESLRFYGNYMVAKKGSEHAVKEYWSKLSTHIHLEMHDRMENVRKADNLPVEPTTQEVLLKELCSGVVFKLPNDRYSD